MSKHNPCPWTVDSGEYNVAETARHSIRGPFPPVDFSTETRESAYKRDEDTANRIVACVNACDGLNPKAIPSILEAAKRLVREWESDEVTVGCYEDFKSALALSESASDS
jgi:hypothetical protein